MEQRFFVIRPSSFRFILSISISVKKYPLADDGGAGDRKSVPCVIRAYNDWRHVMGGPSWASTTSLGSSSIHFCWANTYVIIFHFIGENKCLALPRAMTSFMSKSSFGIDLCWDRTESLDEDLQQTTHLRWLIFTQNLSVAKAVYGGLVGDTSSIISWPRSTYTTSLLLTICLGKSHLSMVDIPPPCSVGTKARFRLQLRYWDIE